MVLRSPAAIELAERLVDYTPGDLNKVFFTTGGGEAVETAWKLAKQYFKLVGKPMKHKVISRAIAYHGTPQGALAITGIPAAKQMFEPLMPGGFKVPNTNFYRAPEHGDDLEAFGRWAADRIEEAIEFEGPDTVAAVFLEPVQNSGGCFPPPPGYFQRVREICDRHDVLLVSDEVICAFGRLGTHVRLRQVRLRARHDHLRQGHDERILPDRRLHRQRPDRRAVLAGRDLLPARLHLRRPPGVGRGGHGQPRHLRAGGAAPSMCWTTRPPSGRRWRSCSTCRSSATCAATGTSTASSWSRTRRPRRRSTTDESEWLLRGFLSKALFEAGLYCRADDRGDPVVQLSPPLIIGQPEFDEIEQILRSVLTEAWARIQADGYALADEATTGSATSESSGNAGPKMLEDQVRLGERDVGVTRQVHDHEVAQILGARRRDVQVEVHCAGQEEHVEHLGQRGDLGREVADLAAGVRLQPNRDHGLDRTAERGWIHVGVVAADHASVPQRSHPSETGRRGDADPLGQRVVRQPRVGDELVQDALVDVVDRPRRANILRNWRRRAANWRTIRWTQPPFYRIFFSNLAS